jgi:hypothetical protein
MPFHLKFRHDNDSWLIRGLPRDPVGRFAELGKCLEFAKQQCAAEPATIEFFVDGLYIVTVFQEQGWPLQLCRPVSCQAATTEGVSRPGGTSKIGRLIYHLREEIEAGFVKLLRIHHAAPTAARSRAAKLWLWP